LFESLGMTQFVNSLTRDDNLFDVIASVDSSAIKGVSVNDGGRMSDHQLIVAKLASHRSKRNVRHQCHNIKAVDPISCERELRNSSLFSCPESAVDGFTEQLQRVVITVLDILALVRPQSGCRPKPSLQKESVVVSSVAGCPPETSQIVSGIDAPAVQPTRR
jgi:hypothetical protein